jgi:hypothetical protein
VRPSLFFSIFIFLLFFQSTLAQVQGLHVDSTWRSGDVLLSNNTILKGHFQFDSYSAIVSFKEDSEDEPDSFDKSKVVAMEIFDSELQMTRRFARLEYKSKDGIQSSALCEFVMETKTFFVLSQEFLQAEGKLVQGRTLSGMPYGAPTTVNRGHSLNERIFFMEKGSELLEEVLFVPKMIFVRRNFVYGGLDGPVFNDAVMEKYLQSYWPEIKTYMKANKIKLKKYIYEDAKVRDEPFQVLGYYVRLERGSW